MTSTIKCPLCGMKLERLTLKHIKSKKHQDILKCLDINPSEDPALKLVKYPKEETEKMQYKSEDHKKLDIPLVPEPPKREKLELKSANIPVDIGAMKRAEKEGKKAILVNCQRCNAVIFAPIPVELVLNSNLPVVPITYVHYNPEGKDKHGITIFLDHDFDIRRQRISDIIFQD
jgi:hypothetical protein